jgi:plasmid stabilization system protein ParE
MGSQSLYFHPKAISEANAAAHWYQERSYTAGKAFVSELDRIIEKNIETPGIYPSYIGETRRALFHRFLFSVVYRIVSERIEVVAIAHGRRKPGYWKDRLA